MRGFSASFFAVGPAASFALSRVVTTAGSGGSAALSGVATAGGASRSTAPEVEATAAAAATAAASAATLSAFVEGLVSTPARLNFASAGLDGTRVSSTSFRSMPGATGATGTISSAATSCAKKRVGSSSLLTASAPSFFPNVASQSGIDCGRSVGRIVIAASIACRKRLVNPGQVPSASAVPMPPWSRSSTSGGFSPVTHSYSTTPSA